ncbi:DUF4185 domain-containing protein [Roseiconus nitratireducens]|uniref:DUF4185 domain-containing protein n=1 Tax=Roseiconus nitratireducens TaxID=2605748 RepID=A0A5M6D369_9BACT|nr:DUF4185 domain-containing protein [Roseiconus nitratireducens]
MSAADRDAPFRIEVVDQENGWPVPLVSLTTTHQVEFVTDNAGVIAIDQSDLMGREVFFDVNGRGYEVAADGFGIRGVRLTPERGGSARVEVHRTIIAKRVGRLTGAGQFVHRQQFSEPPAGFTETGVYGCDSVQLATHRGRLFWLWGDTTLARYPLGIFDSSSATTSLRPLNHDRPPLQIDYEYFRDDEERLRGVAKMPGSGPTWLSGYVSLNDHEGQPHLVATYTKIRPPLEAYERGLCVWDDGTERFERSQVLWSKTDDSPEPPPAPMGHVALWNDASGHRWALFGDPFPTMRMPATFEAWQNPQTWETLRPQAKLVAGDGTEKAVRPHSGSIAWNAHRNRWVTVFMQRFGDPSAFGELWYAESDAPTGPWGPAIKILSHDNYTFYNPRVHPELTDPDSPYLLFEGTYTKQFADSPPPTPRYDYNQILYRLDLQDDRLQPAHGASLE